MFQLYRQIKKQRRNRTLSIEEIKRAHEEGREQELLHGNIGGQYVGDFVFGAIDGVVTTFAVVAGVAGADLAASVVVVLGLANLLADGFAMGIGNFLSIRSEHEHYRHERDQEAWEIDHIPEHERQEIRDIYAAKGFDGEILKQIVTTITADKKRWLTTMMSEELGLSDDPRSPLTGGFITYVAFVTIGLIPLLSFVFELALPGLHSYAFQISVGLTMVALFIIGALKTVVVPMRWQRAGLETLFMGGLAALVAYVVGYLLRGLA